MFKLGYGPDSVLPYSWAWSIGVNRVKTGMERKLAKDPSDDVYRNNHQDPFDRARDVTEKELASVILLPSCQVKVGKGGYL